ncbi:MAG: hypothetical protein ABIH42_10770, partial [Planctomycetota bacterium]
ESFGRDGSKKGKLMDTKYWFDDIAMGPRGDLFCVSEGYQKVMRVDTASATKWTLKTPKICKSPSGVSFDKYGRMYLFDDDSKWIVKFKEVMR